MWFWMCVWWQQNCVGGGASFAQNTVYSIVSRSKNKSVRLEVEASNRTVDFVAQKVVARVWRESCVEVWIQLVGKKVKLVEPDRRLVRGLSKCVGSGKSNRDRTRGLTHEANADLLESSFHNYHALMSETAV